VIAEPNAVIAAVKTASKGVFCSEAVIRTSSTVTTASGAADNDTLFGGTGRDELSGGLGRDRCDGDGGNSDSAFGCEVMIGIPQPGVLAERDEQFVLRGEVHGAFADGDDGRSHIGHRR
jgi:Ca2+-binding RTX toxin-like protein